MARGFRWIPTTIGEYVNPHKVETFWVDKGPYPHKEPPNLKFSTKTRTFEFKCDCQHKPSGDTLAQMFGEYFIW